MASGSGRRKERPEWRHVYFIEAEGLGRVKIGCADNAKRRLAELQTGSPVRLILRGVIPNDDAHHFEDHFHRHYAADRLIGEWFNLTPEIEELIQAMASDPEAVRFQLCRHPSRHERGSVTVSWMPDDTAETFAARVWKVGHALYPDVYIPG